MHGSERYNTITPSV